MVRNFGYKSGREVDKFKKVKCVPGKLGSPIIEDCIAYLECRVISGMTLEVGTHTLFVAEVVDGAVRRDEDPMTYAYFRETKKNGGKQTGEDGPKAPRWVCTVCGYIHTGEGPPAPCPYCGAPREKFVLIKEESGRTAANLTANWDAETEEAGLYLAFGRKADEEGFPEVGEAIYRVALEEAWHAAEIAQLQGKVKSTPENLAWRVEAELGAQKGKAEAAMAAGTEGNPAARDFFSRAARDEGRASLLDLQRPAGPLFREITPGDDLSDYGNKINLLATCEGGFLFSTQVMAEEHLQG